MVQQLLNGHLRELCELWLFVIVLPGVGRHVRVLSALDWRTLISLVHAITGHHWVWSLCLAMLSSEWRARGFLVATVTRFRFPAFV